MDVRLFRAIIEKSTATQRGDVSPYSREFLFDDRFIALRTIDGGRILGADYARTVLETVVNTLITGEERRAAFPSPYELGSRVSIPPDAQKTQKVLDYLHSIYDHDPQDRIKSIKQAIRIWTGFGFQCFFDIDGSIATKVLCALYRFRTNNYSRLSSLLEPPRRRGRFSFEFRDAYPSRGSGRSYELARRNVSYIADLKARMTFEMTGDHEELRQILERLLIDFENRYFVPPLVVAQGWRLKSDAARSVICELLPLGARCKPARLDVELFIMLTLLEIEHRLLATDELVSFMASEEAKIPIATVPIPSSDWFLPPERYRFHTVQALVEHITALRFPESDFREAWNVSDVLLALTGVPDESGPRLLRRVAAIISVAGEDIRTLNYETWWQGQTEISVRPWHYLTAAAKTGHAGNWRQAINDMPYGYREFWFQRFHCVLYRCMQAEQIWSEGNANASFEIQRVIALFRTHDLDKALELARRYIHHKEKNSAMQNEMIAQQ
jgi:hypothetical protein